MAYVDISTNGMNYVTLRQVVNDYIITLDGDDFASNVSDSAIRNFALRGIREFGFDISAKVKSIKLDIQSNNTVTLPDDYVDIVKLGTVDDSGVVKIFRQNKNLNYSRRILQDTSADQTNTDDTVLTDDSAEGPLDISGNLVLNREDAKSSTSGDHGDLDFYEQAISDFDI